MITLYKYILTLMHTVDSVDSYCNCDW